MIAENRLKNMQLSDPSRRRSRLLAVCLAAILITGCGTAGGPVGETGGTEQSGEAMAGETGGTEQSGEAVTDTVPAQKTDRDILQVQIFKVGRADAIILMCGGKTMVIDCGEEEDGEEVLNYLKGRGQDRIDVLLITHYDKDHVGGADTVVEGITVDRVILPDYGGSSVEVQDFMDALDKARITPEKVTEDLNFTLGQAAVTVEPPSSYEIPENTVDYDNNFSLITTLEFYGKRFVFTGDIEKKRIREWLSSGSPVKCDVLKVPHHGDYNTALEDLFKVLQPSYAVICDSKKNPADELTLELLHRYGADCLQTQYGDISILCSDMGIEIHQR